MTAPTKAMVIAGTHSGVGKTTVALGIMAALKWRGLAVQPFKVGPDFIDPGHHQAVCGLPSRNLDGWMLDREYAIESFRHHCEGKDVAVVEGVMGLFDGIGSGDEGSTAQMARWLKTGVVLVVDARGMSGSEAALINGFKTYRRDVRRGDLQIVRVLDQRGRIELPLDLPAQGLAVLERHSARAWAVEGGGNARLKVSFFWPFRADYWVIGLDADYRWAVVGNPQRKYLWILSRTPKLPQEQLEAALASAGAQGVDLAQLRYTKHEPASGR